MPVLFRNEFWSQLPRVNEALVRRTAERLLVLTGMPDAELSLLLADDKQIAELNSSWRRKNTRPGSARGRSP